MSFPSLSECLANVRLWHLADSLSGLALRPLPGVSRHSPNASADAHL
jgi:hypothetical protein